MADFKEMRLPLTLSDKMVGGPMWSTRVFGVQNGDATRLGLWNYPLHKFDISDGGREIRDAQATKRFHMRARGKLYGFRVLDPNDFTVYAGEGKLIATATPNVYQLVKIYSEDGNTFVRPIKKPIPGQCAVIDNTGTVLATDPIDYTTGLATISGASGFIVNYSWLGCFDVPVCFTDDWLQIGKDTGLLSWKNAHVMEIRRIDVSTGTPPPLVINWDEGMLPLAYAPAPSPGPSPAPSPSPSPAPAPAATVLTSGVASTFPITSGTKPAFTIATTTATNLHVVVTGMGPTSPSYAYGRTLWRRGSAPDTFTFDGSLYGADTADITVSGSGTEYFEIDISTTASGTGSITVTAS